MNRCRWRDSYDICGCGYAELVGQEVDDEVCIKCDDNTEKRYEDNCTGELEYES